MIRLFVNWYIEKKQPRGKELNLCIEKNFHCEYIDEIVNLSDTPLPETGKFKNIQIDHRPTYSDFLKVVSDLAQPKDVSIIANMDIYFDETILLTKRMTDRDAYALTRWDVNAEGITFMNRADSQDVWIFKGKPKEVKGANINLGTPGCDNAMAYLIKKAGYRISNPSLSIKTYHVHSSGTRHYLNGNKQIVKSAPEPYLLLKPTML